MKFAAIVVLSLIATVCSAPTQITDNNVGDIITVGLKANVDVTSQVDVNVINMFAALVSQQLGIIQMQEESAAPEPIAAINEFQPIVNEIHSMIETNEISQPQPAVIGAETPKITPEMIEKAKQYLYSLKQQ